MAGATGDKLLPIGCHGNRVGALSQAPSGDMLASGPLPHIDSGISSAKEETHVVSCGHVYGGWVVGVLVANGDYMATIWTKGGSCNASVVLAQIGKLSASVQVKDTKRWLATLLLTRTPVLVVRFPCGVCSEGAKRQYLANGNAGSIGGDGYTCHGLLGFEEADLTRHVCVCLSATWGAASCALQLTWRFRLGL